MPFIPSIAIVSDAAMGGGEMIGQLSWFSGLYIFVVLLAALAPRTWWWCSPLAIFWPIGFWLMVSLLQ